MAYLFEGARVILPHGVEEVSVRVEGEAITGLDVPADGARRIDAGGMVLAPAMVDIHGDAFERQVMPRPNVFFPVEAAALETDRHLAANGIATAYHALTLSWEPGLRSVERGESFLDTLGALRPRLTVENRVQLRWETFAFEAEPLIAKALGGALKPAIAFNDHTSMSMRAFDVPIQGRPFEQSPDYAIAALDDARLKQRTAGNAKRSGLSVEDYIDLLARVWGRREEVGTAIARVAEAGRSYAAPMLSHDDTQVQTRDYYRGLGARIAEFPMTVEVARAAREAGDMIVFGAPNAVRGGSHIGSPSAAEMVEQGLCDILASDYFYPAMLASVARLLDEGRAPLHALWKTVSTNPARASGLHDRGEIAPGRRADLVLLDWPEGHLPAVCMTLSGGRLAYGTEKVLA
ncbi:MAG: alpha-D-ribose 1-methylphosphonate 5-triphosphate diphosphatase [Paracoccaceae bacterium]